MFEQRCRAIRMGAVLVGGITAVVIFSGCTSPGTGGGGGQRDNDNTGDGGAVDNVLTLDTPEGRVSIASDSRMRPVEIEGPLLSATLAWSNDGRRVTAHVVTGDVDNEATVSVDLGDDALREAAGSLEEQTDANLDDFRQFLDDNPGLVARVAAGDSTGLPAKVLTRMQAQTSVTRLLVDLRIRFAHLMRFADDWRHEQEVDPQGVPEPFRSAIHQQLRDLAYSLWMDYQQQLQACTACNASCRADCRGESIRGACCREDLGCDDDVTESECPSVFFHAGALCLEIDCSAGCCCVDLDGPNTPMANFDQPPHEQPATAEECAQILLDWADTNLIGVTTFFPGASCDVSPCIE